MSEVENELMSLKSIIIPLSNKEHSSSFEFKWAKIDKDIYKTISLKLSSFPDQFFGQYECSVILSPSTYNQSLSNLYHEANSDQQTIWKTLENYISEMKTIHHKYEKNRALIWDYNFRAYLSEMKTASDTITLSVKLDDIIKFHELVQTSNLSSMLLVLSPLE